MNKIFAKAGLSERAVRGFSDTASEVASVDLDLEPGDAPVTTALYEVMIVMREDDPSATDESARHALAAEVQRALDNGYFGHGLRYDRLEFKVISRTVLSREVPR